MSARGKSKPQLSDLCSCGHDYGTHCDGPRVAPCRADGCHCRDFSPRGAASRLARTCGACAAQRAHDKLVADKGEGPSDAYAFAWLLGFVEGFQVSAEGGELVSFCAEHSRDFGNILKTTGRLPEDVIAAMRGGRS